MTAREQREAPAMSSDEPTHYEVLGVRPGASPAAIRRAWRRRTAKAGPGSPELARLNDAADTLLDPERRAAYDDTLPSADTAAGSADAADDTGDADAAAATGRAGRTRTRAAVAVVAVLAVLASVAAGLFTYQHRHDAQVESARVQAAAAAQQALPALLSYDYRHMDSDLRAAVPFLTPGFAKTYTRNFHLLSNGRDGQPAPVQQTKTVVQARVLGTAVMDAGTDQVHVLAFVDQTSRHRAGPSQQACSPCVLQDRIQVTMVHRNDAWLVAGLNPG